ncbi:MAG: WD40/YVTN/BNR-like repeat-containing protein, partial [Gemmatimonadales bacterium]
VHVSRDGGSSWTNVTARVPGAPRLAYVSKVEPSHFDDGTVYVAFDSHRTGDYGTYLYTSTDFGTTFRSIAANLPKGEVVRTISEDQHNPDVLYVGTETGLWVSTTRGREWSRVRANLPTVPVYEITQHPRDNAMILATHGRGIWILDDMAPLQQYGTVAVGDGGVFPSAGAVLRLPMTDQERSYQGDMIFLGENPPLAAFVNYWLKDKPDSVRLEITDGAGAVVREIKGDTAKASRPAAGLNIARWDLRIQPIEMPKSDGGDVLGPLVLPATYVATVFANGRKIGTANVVVRADQESQITSADRAANFAIEKELLTIIAHLNAAVAAVRRADTLLGAIRPLLADTVKTPARYRASLDSLTRMLAPLKLKFAIVDEGEDIEFTPDMARGIVTNKVGGLSGTVSGFLAGPSSQDLRMLDEVRHEAPAAIAETNLLTGKLAEFVRQLVEAGIYPALPKPVK